MTPLKTLAQRWMGQGDLARDVEELDRRTKSLEARADTGVDLLGERIAYTADIIDKQYRSYTWNDGKVQALVAIDTALVAGILLLIQILGISGGAILILLQLAMAILLTSLIICLVHAIPRLDSGIGNQWNHRTMVGILQYASKERRDGYYKHMIDCDRDELLKMNCSQIVGMSKNNKRSQVLILWGVRLTIVGVTLLGIALLGWTSSQGGAVLAPPLPTPSVPAQTSAPTSIRTPGATASPTLAGSNASASNTP